MLEQTREDRKIREFVEKWRPSKAPEILRSMERNAKTRDFLARRKNMIECHLCVRASSITYPMQIEVCGSNKHPGCLMKIAKRYGNVGLISKRFTHKFELCMHCLKQSHFFHKVVVRVCHKCYKKLGKKDTERKKEVKRARTRSEIRRFKERIAS